LEPPYVIQYGIVTLMTAGVICFGLNEAAHPSAGRLVQQAVAGLFYQHTLIFGEPNVVNGVLWSLEIEVQFYVLAPLLALLFTMPKPVRRGCMAALIVLSAAMAYGFDDVTRVRLSIVGQLQFFLVGFLLADWYTTERRADAQPRLRWDLLCIAGFCALGCMDSLALRTLMPAAILLAYLGMLRGGVAIRFFRNPWVVTIGGMCYTIYMYHFTVLVIFGRLLSRYTTGKGLLAAPLMQILAIGGLTLAFCSIAFVLFERPFMQRDWHTKFWSFLRRKPNAKAVGGPARPRALIRAGQARP
jgi:peptidoglycan/LPS O-acetylase OafA/YrhL